MKPKTFYPEIVLKVEEVDYDKAELKGITDNGEKINVVILNDKERPKTEEFKKFVVEKAKKAVSKTMVDTITEKIAKEPSITEQIEEKVKNEHPEALNSYTKFMKIFMEEIRKTAEEIAENMYRLDKGMTIKIGGITDSSGKNVSARMNFDLRNKKNPGFYILSVPNAKNILFQKIPIKLVPLKEEGKYKAVVNSRLATLEEVKNVFRVFLKTLKAAEDGKITSKPRLYISYKTVSEQKPEEKELSKIIEDLNDYQKEGKHVLKEMTQKLKTLVDILENNGNLYKNIGVFLPLEPLTLNPEKLLDDVKEKMSRTTFHYSLANNKLTENEIDAVFEEVFKERQPVFQTFYKLKTDKNRYGFFTDSVLQNNIVLGSTDYNRIIEKIDDITRKKNFEVEKKEKEQEKGVWGPK